ncbi:hypothetical protein MRX96_042901 [Rhipicephalus microplus]
MVFETSAENKQDGESDIVKVTVRSIMGTSITTSWSRPEYQFDFYKLEMTEDKLDANGRTYRANLGSCGISKYARNETVTSCGDFEGCTHVNLEIFAYSHGLPDHARLVSGVEGIFVPGQDPDPPSNLTMVQISPATTRLHWEPPVKVHGRFHGYTIKKCEKFTSCERGENMHACSESHTLEEWLDINNYVNSELCVLVTARARCGSQTLSSRPLVGKLTNISFVVPKVANITLIDVGPDYFTVSWTKPAVSFDYYWVEVLYIGDESDMLTPHRVGSCANGTVVHRSQTQITCDKFKACANVTFTVHAHVETASQLTFPGTTLRGIFLPGKDLPEVRQLKLTEMDKDSITVSWQRPEGCFEGYIVEVAEESSGSGGVGGLSAGSCAGGITVDAEHTSITCRKIEARNVKITIRTQRKGQLEFTSPGVTLNNIVMYKKVLPDVTNFSLTDVGPDSFTVSWARPSSYFDYYWVEVYDNSNGTDISTPHRVGSCAYGNIIHRDQNQITCDKFKACVNASITVHAQSKGPSGLTSPGATLRGIFMPGRVLPDLDNLTLVDIGPDHFTVSWMHPVAQFDYYWLEVYKRDDGSDTITPQRVGSCANGTIVHREQTRITCDMFKPCSNVTITLHTQAKGTSELVSTGATLQGIFMPGKGIPEVVKLKQTAVAKNSVTLSWERPKGCFNDYLVTTSAENTELSSQETSAGTCGNGTIVPANETSVTCDGIRASSVSIMVQTRRLKSDGLISQGVTLQGIAMSKLGTQVCIYL